MGGGGSVGLGDSDIYRPSWAIFSDYLCPPEANVYDIEFVRFKIRDLESGMVLFEISKPPSISEWPTNFFNYQLARAVCTQRK